MMTQEKNRGAGAARNRGLDYERIYFTSRANQPFIYLLFAAKYDPVLFAGDPEKIIDYSYFGRVYGFGKYLFLPPEDMPLSGFRALYVTRADYHLPKKRIIHTIVDPGGRKRFLLWE
jgi:hypothetical protein